MSTSFYDVLIAGTDLAGLILGAMCAKKGYRVLIIGQGSRRNRYMFGSYTFKRRPFLLTSADASTPARQVLGDLSLSMEMRNRPRRCEPSYQVVGPNHRMDFSSRAERLDTELTREFGAGAAIGHSFAEGVKSLSGSVGEFLKRNPVLPPEGWSERREFQRLAGDFPALIGQEPLADPFEILRPGEFMRAASLAPVLFSAALDVEDGPVLPRARCAAQVMEGVFRLDGGLDAFKDIFVQKLRQHASDIRPEIALDGLEIKRGKVVEGFVRDRRESIGCHMLVCNSDIKRFFQLVPPEHQKERYHHRIHTLQPSHYLFTINIAVSTAGLPEGIASDVFVLQDPRRPLSGDNLLFVQLESEPAPTGKGASSFPAVTVATVSCRLPARTFAPSASFVGEMTHRVLVRLRESIFPFLDEHLLAMHCPWVATDAMTGEQRFDASELLPIYRGKEELTLDSSALPVQTEYKNILVCSDPIFGGLGLEGSFLAAMQAYRKITEQVVLKTLLS